MVQGLFSEEDMAKVTVRKDENVEKAIRRFKRKVEKEGIMKDLRNKRCYKKPSVRKKEKKKLAEKRRRKLAKRRNRADRY